jgi:hypothetical protein
VTLLALRDRGNEVARQYGIVHEVPPDLQHLYANKLRLDLSIVNGEWALPMPARFVIDRNGIVRSVENRCRLQRPAGPRHDPRSVATPRQLAGGYTTATRTRPGARRALEERLTATASQVSTKRRGGPLNADASAGDDGSTNGRGSLMPVGDVCCNSSSKHPETGRTGATATHQRPTWNSSRPRLFRKIRGHQSWPSRTHDPKVAGSNPAPATTCRQTAS